MSQAAQKFYFIRHGQTEANLSDLAAGAGWDIELNETGLAQAKALAESEQIKVCADTQTICVSPLLRARQTAEALKIVIDAPVVVIDELKEWHLGDWEKTPWSNLPNIFEPGTNPPNGEKQLEFGMRVSNGLNQALAQPGPVLIVAHGGVWHAICRILSIKAGSIENCAVKCVIRDDGDQPWRLGSN
ncbi:MAG: histidine phosphatase family protein [Cyanobacteria bacterium SZAS LIN-3]|nr:histidine phosphatase family protein [Cyanobacteria bacterium SZAS LIN-3]